MGMPIEMGIDNQNAASGDFFYRMRQLLVSLLHLSALTACALSALCGKNFPQPFL